MSEDSAPVECSVSYEWRFEAPLGLVGVATRDGRLLAPPAVGEEHVWVRPLPLPVMGWSRVSRGSEGRAGLDHPPVPVALIDRVMLHEAELVGCGRFADDALGRHYAGALALDVVAFGLDLDQCVPQDGAEGSPVQDAVVFESWRIMGAHLVRDAAWEPDRLSRPRVWRERVTGG